MYNIPYFKENDEQVLLQFINDNPFAFLSGSDANGKPVATQIPLLMEQRKDGLYLLGHIMRNTNHHKAFIQNPQVLAVFTGPHTYVSGSWYSNPHTASTWNYMSVQISGTIQFLPDEGLIELMKKLTLRFEDNNPGSSTIYDNLPADYLKKLMPAITGFEIKAEAIENVFKLSQNRDEQSYLNIIEKLEAKVEKGNSHLIAEEMRKRFGQLFPVTIGLKVESE